MTTSEDNKSEILQNMTTNTQEDKLGIYWCKQRLSMAHDIDDWTKLEVWEVESVRCRAAKWAKTKHKGKVRIGETEAWSTWDLRMRCSSVHTQALLHWNDARSGVPSAHLVCQRDLQERKKYREENKRMNWSQRIKSKRIKRLSEWMKASQRKWAEEETMYLVCCRSEIRGECRLRAGKARGACKERNKRKQK